MEPTTKLNRAAVPFTLFEPYEPGSRPGVVRKRTLKFTLNSLADFEQEMGMGFAQLMHNKATFGTARALLWAGLKHEDRVLTLERVGDLMGDVIGDDGGDVNTFLELCLKACADQGALGPNVKRAALPEGEPSKPEEMEKKKENESPVTLDVSPIEKPGDDLAPGQPG